MKPTGSRKTDELDRSYPTRLVWIIRVGAVLLAVALLLAAIPVLRVLHG